MRRRTVPRAELARARAALRFAAIAWVANPSDTTADALATAALDERLMRLRIAALTRARHA